MNLKTNSMQPQKSDRAAGAVTPGKSDRAAADRGSLDHNTGRHHHGSLDDHRAPIGPAFPVRITVPARATAAFGACGAETCNRACNQNCRE